LKLIAQLAEQTPKAVCHGSIMAGKTQGFLVFSGCCTDMPGGNYSQNTLWVTSGRYNSDWKQGLDCKP